MVKILVFSPSFRMRAMIVGILTSPGVEVESVTSRRALFKRCAEKLFDRVVIEDYRLFMDGGGSVERIRTHFATRPKIVVLSTVIDEQTVLSLLECGIDQYLLLPVSPARLRRKVCNQ
ncbi:MAG: response regulator transcription factor [Alistipes sp.]|nr:response regulator transcription factor [Alistipes sp.]